MNQFLSKIWQAVKDSIKWILIQYAVLFCLSFLYYGSLYIWSVFSDYSFRDLSIIHQIGGHTVYSWYTALLFAIPNYTVLFSIWHVFFNKNKQWWTIFIPWGLFLGWVYLEIAKGLDWNYKIITVDEYMLAGWLSPLYGALLQVIIIFFRKKKTTKKQEQEYQEMISSVLGMFDRANVTREDIEKHLIKVTDADLEELLENSKSIPPEKPLPGYYIPSDRNFINHSLEKYPDKVYLLKKIEPLILKDEDIEGEFLFGRCLDVNNMNKDLYVFLFDSFGCPGTHLCARRGYAIYDRDIKDIVAYHWKWIS